MEYFESKLVFAVDGLLSTSRRTEGSCQLKEKDCHHTINDFKITFTLFSIPLLCEIALIVLKEVNPQEVDVICKFFHFDNI